MKVAGATIAAMLVIVLLATSPGPVQGAVEKPSRWHTPPVGWLLGKEFSAQSITGNYTVGGIEIRFFMHADDTRLSKKPTLVFNAGCNTIGAKFVIRSGRLVSRGDFSGTKIGCDESGDMWLVRNLKHGMKIRVRKGLLYLSRPAKGVKIVLYKTS